MAVVTTSVSFPGGGGGGGSGKKFGRLPPWVVATISESHPLAQAVYAYSHIHKCDANLLERDGDLAATLS